MGAFERYEYRAVGDVVNTCARLEELNRTLGTRILVSAELAEGVEPFLFRDLGWFRLQGKRARLRVLELVTAKCAAKPRQRALCEAFARALGVYQTGELGLALKHFGELALRYPGDGPSRFFLRRCLEGQGKGDARLGLERRVAAQ